MFLDHTQRRSTVGRTPLNEWSARRRDLYLTTHNIHNRQISMPSGGIRTHDLSMRATADLRLRQCGHWDRQGRNVTVHISEWNSQGMTLPSNLLKRTEVFIKSQCLFKTSKHVRHWRRTNFHYEIQNDFLFETIPSQMKEFHNWSRSSYIPFTNIFPYISRSRNWLNIFRLSAKLCTHFYSLPRVPHTVPLFNMTVTLFALTPYATCYTLSNRCTLFLFIKSWNTLK